jgi:hypothetical protein
MPSEKAQYVSSAIALAVTVGAFLGAFYVLKYLVGIDNDEVAGGIAGLSFGLFVNIDQALKTGRFRVLHPTRPRSVVPLNSYALPWPLMILYGVLLSLPVFLSLIMTPFLHSFANERFGAGNAVVLFLVVVIAVGGSVLFGIGFWVGTRCNRLSLLVVLAIAALSGQIDAMLISPLLGAVAYDAQDYALAKFAYQGAIIGFLSLPPMLVGLWWGRRKRTSNYLNYLMSCLSEDDQRAVLGLIYDSAKEGASDSTS